ncbi:MAG: class I SAM-dependent methyltransferase family protein [Candidatus Dadabacteria bacterium]|nr:class I SAM-dependent methyltransferase family protein [Candidatus Dadabacteria bacterium]
MQRNQIPSFEELQKPLTSFDSRSLYYKSVSFLLRNFGRFSEGIRIGYRHGFDSGNIMNYIYENEPLGHFYVGKVIDRAFLNQKTCKAFRSIKKIQKDMISNYLKQREGKETFIVDLACGKADYIYDVMKESNPNVNVLLADINESTLMESKQIAENLGLSENISYRVGDALDIQSLKNITPKPNLVIEVGLYGIIHDDELLRNHLKLLKDILNPEALLFNVQTYNEQIELIARALINQDGQPCVWHLRPVELVIGWAEEAGFKNPEITMDPYDIYAVVMMKG